MYELTLKFENKEQLLSFLGASALSHTAVPELPPAPTKEERAARRASKVVASPQSGVGQNTDSLASGSSPAVPSETEGQAGISTASDTAEVVEKTVTIDDIRLALSDVNARKGIEAAKELLVKFGATRISDLDPSKYAQFLRFAKSEV